MDSSEEIDADWLANLVNHKSQGASPVKLVSYDSGRAAPKGYNYSSNVSRVKLKMMLASGTMKTISLIVKQSERKTIGTDSFMPAHRGEVKMYGTVFPMMEALMDENEDKRDTLWAKFYGFTPFYNTIVVEDLKEQNYQVIDRMKWQNQDSALLVLRNIARFHAMSKVLLDRRLIDKNDTTQCFFAGDDLTQHCLFRGPLKILCGAMMAQTGSWTAEWVEYGKRIEKQIPTICTKLDELASSYDKKFEVLNHGDLWSSNMMFKRLEYTDLLVAVKFFDYEANYLNSFMWDVIHFMFTSVRPSIRRASRDVLLKAYHESLTDNLKFFNCQTYIPSMEDVEAELARLMPVAFIMVTVILPMSSATSEKAFDLATLFTHPPEEVFDETIFNEEKFVEEIGGDLKFFCDHSII